MWPVSPWCRVSVFFSVQWEAIKEFLVGNCFTRILLLLCQDHLLKDKRGNKEAVKRLLEFLSLVFNQSNSRGNDEKWQDSGYI